MKLIKWLPSIFWMGFIFFLSSQPTTSIHGTLTERFFILKSFHLIEYAILAIFFYFAIQKYHYSIILAYLFALSDEYHQTFTPGRTGKLFDTVYDLIGILIGIIFIKYISKYVLNLLSLIRETILASTIFTPRKK